MTGYNFFLKITNLFSRNISNQVLLKNIFYIIFFINLLTKRNIPILFYFIKELILIIFIENKVL